MNRNIYFLLCTLFVFGCYQARADHPPVFIAGHTQSLTVCENSSAAPINTMLAITDPDIGQTEVWGAVIGAAHGTLFASAATIVGGAGIVTPSGLSYTPTPGYSGNDSFSVRVNDGTFSDTTTIYVIINPIPAAIGGTRSICLGFTTSLSDVGTGTWSTTGTTATVDPSLGVVTGTGTGNATITYTFPTGCKTTAVVTVNPVPNPVAGTFSVCSGFTVGIFDGGGGTWVSGNTSVATINAGSGYYTGVSRGSVVMTYTLPDGCSTTAIVTINQTPSAISGVTNVCKGTTITLSDSWSGGLWSSSNAALATIDGGGNFTGVSAGTVYITYTLGSCNAVTTMTIAPEAPVTGTGALCVGRTLTLSNTVGGGTWSSAISGVATVSASGFVTAIAPGTAVISYETPAGCFSSATVTVNAVPTPIYVLGSTSICVGATTSLSDGYGGGAWASSNTTIATVDNVTGIVTGSATGFPIITYTLSSGCSISIAITINPIPAAIAGVMSVCSGQAASLRDGWAGAWSSTNTAVATINSGSGYYTGLAADTVTIVYTLPGGCFTGTVVTINPTPSAITGASVVCQSAELVLGESFPGGIWSSSNPAIATISSGLVTTVSAGSVTITYTLGYCLVTKSILINPEAPITGITTMCNGGTTILANAIGGGMWSSATPGVATITSYGFVASISPGITEITYALPSGCFTNATVVVNLVPSPITGVTHMCVGATTFLSDPDGGGSWSTSSATLATVDAATGFVTGLATGVPVITYALSTGCKVTVPVTVNPLPSPIGGIFSVCAGYEVGLSDGGGGTWISSNTLVATISPLGFVTGMLPGSSTMTYTLPTSCSTNAVFTVNTSPAPITGPSLVCQGDSIILVDAVGLGTWSTISAGVLVNASTGAVTGETPGLAAIVYSIGSCTTSKVIDVSPITPVSGIFSLCSGASTTLSDLTPGGTWSSSNTTIATITPVTGSLTGIGSGVVLITYTSAAGCIATIAFTVNPVPAPITGASDVCMDSTITLIDSTPGGIWTESVPPVASIDPLSGVLTAFATGVPVITYSFSTGCKVTERVTIRPLPNTITGPDALCAGLLTGLREDGSGTWSTNNSAIATVTPAGYVKGVSAGSVIITYTNNGCIALKNITIEPVPPPITGDTFICIGLSTTFVDSGGGLWTTNDETTGLIFPTGTMYGQVAGSATITYTLPATGCYATQLVNVKDCHLAVKPLANSGSDLHLLPNPNNGAFIIKGSLGTLSDAEVSIAITNMLGQSVYANKAIAKEGSIDQDIQLGNNLPPGMYLVNLLWANETKTFQVVIQQ